VLLWLLLWCCLLILGLALAVARPATSAETVRPLWPTPLRQLLDAWPLAAALFQALLGLAPVLLQVQRRLFHVSL
jgi:hypothetical protein